MFFGPRNFRIRRRLIIVLCARQNGFIRNFWHACMHHKTGESAHVRSSWSSILLELWGHGSLVFIHFHYTHTYFHFSLYFSSRKRMGSRFSEKRNEACSLVDVINPNGKVKHKTRTGITSAVKTNSCS